MEERRPYRGVPFSERRKPLGLIAKYPNYEPFHPPPTEDFVYPTHMHPPPQRQQRQRHSSPPIDYSPPRKHYRHDGQRRPYEDKLRIGRRDSRSPSPRSGRDCFRIRSSSREFYRRRSSSRDFYRRRSSSRDFDRRRSNSRDFDRRRSTSRDFDRRRSTSRDFDRRRSTSRDFDRRHSPSREFDRRRSQSPERDQRRSPSCEDVEERLETEVYWERENSEAGSEAELDEELLSLVDHVHDSKALITQAIRSLRGKRLKAMIPPVLRETPIVQLELKCLAILKKLDPQTVFNILDGRMAKMVEESTKKENSSEEEEEEPVELLDVPSKPKKRKAKKKEDATIKKIKKKVVKKKKKKKTVDDAPKTLMELLELEYRAKAIKALLRTQGVSLVEDFDATDLVPTSEQTVDNNANTAVNETEKFKVDTPDCNNSPLAEPDTTTKAAEEEEELEEVSSEEELEEEETMIDMVQKVLEETVDETGEDAGVGGRLGSSSTRVSLYTGSYSSLEEDKLRSKLLEIYARRQSTDENAAGRQKSSKVKPRMKKAVDVLEDDVLELHAASSGEEEVEEEVEDCDFDEEGDEEEEMPGEVDVLEDKTAWNDILGGREETMDSIHAASDPPEDEDGNSHTVMEEEEETGMETVLPSEDEVECKVDQTSSLEEDESSVDKGVSLEEHVDHAMSEEEEDEQAISVDEDNVKATSAEEDEQTISEEDNVKATSAEEDEQTISEEDNVKATSAEEDEQTISEEEDNVKTTSAEDDEQTISEEEDNVKATSIEEKEIEYTSVEVEDDKAKSDEEEEEDKVTSIDEETVTELPQKSPKEDGEINSDFSENNSEKDNTNSPISDESHHFTDDVTPKQTPPHFSDVNRTQDETSDAPVRPKSPVEFITSFEDDKSEDDDEVEDEVPLTTVAEVSETTQSCEYRPPDDNATPSNDITTTESELPVTWYERWFNSKGMQKVVKTNTIQKKLRRKLKDAETQKKKLKEPPILDVNVAVDPIIGSIEEYEKLFGKKVVDVDAAESATAVPSAPPEDEEDEDDLWGAIIDT